MKNHSNIFLIVIITLGFLIIVVKQRSDYLKLQNDSNLQKTATEPSVIESVPNQQKQNAAQQKSGAQSSPDFQPPLDQPAQRITKKPFGIFVTPGNSPVQPERFYGYHTGADFETFDNEKNTDVVVHAVCRGKLLEKRYASGYGGVAVQSCNLNGQPMTVVYGHLKLSSIDAGTGSELEIGQTIGLLGKGYSSETDGERKHLHLGFHKGTAINIMGYVQRKSQLSEWIDPCQYVCEK